MPENIEDTDIDLVPRYQLVDQIKSLRKRLKTCTEDVQVIHVALDSMGEDVNKLELALKAAQEEPGRPTKKNTKAQYLHFVTPEDERVRVGPMYGAGGGPGGVGMKGITKIDYSRAHLKFDRRFCNAPSCVDPQVRPGLLACGKHWPTIPKAVRADLDENARPGRRNQAWWAAATQALRVLGA